MAEADARKPWYRNGLRFTCTQCGDCCTGEEGFVWVDEEEIARLARRLQMDASEFEKRYLRRVARGVSLRERDDGACVFWRRGEGCTVYSDRPRQCRSWPFWNSNISTPADWRRTTQICPGAGVGRIFTAEEILEQSRIIDL
jgi:Fe-S-cluster containining protein